MAILMSKEMDAHRNIYKESMEEGKRKIRVEIGIPDAGITMETGMLIFIPGYGAGIDSHVWKRMRSEFCDIYNMITVQCDYFGNKYMDSRIPEKLSEFLASKNVLNANVRYERELLETEEEFNDMGIMQALDIVSATLGTIYELEQMGHHFNAGKIILFGSSHGSYLSHMANIICPDLYSCILDISAYVIPYYLGNCRMVIVQDSKSQVEIIIKQFLNVYPQYRYSKQLYDLRFLYEHSDNNCNIVAFQGTDDWMVDAQEKMEFIEKINNAEMILVAKEDVDEVLFKNADHGLGLDFFVFFQMIMPMIEELFIAKDKVAIRKRVVIAEGDVGLAITYNSGLPELEFISR